MSDKFIAEKLRLHEFLERRGVSYNSKTKTWRCPNHEDEHESAVLYENPDGGILYCPVCAKSWDIFAVCGIIDNLPEFKDQLKMIHDTLLITESKTGKEYITKKIKKKNPQPFPANEKQKKAIEEKIKSLTIEKEWGEIKGSWKYFDENGNTIALDIRFEKEGQRKNIITFWYERSLKWYDAPVFVYGLNRLITGKKILIHEGAKCADIGEKILSEFSNLSWSGGSGKAQLADWSILKNYDVYILPDNDSPGQKAAYNIRQQLPDAKIIRIEKIGDIKKGDDIEQFLNFISPEKLIEFILNPKNHLKTLNDSEIDPGSSTILEQDQAKHPPWPSGPGSISESFKILGLGDDGRAAFITEEGRLVKWTLDTMSKNKLLVLANQSYWSAEYPAKGSANWDNAINDIIRVSSVKDFNESDIRGRGAWRDGEKISYHDGRNTIGEYDQNKIYLRLRKKDIGINDPFPEQSLLTEIKNIVFQMSFETLSDAVRCLGWSVLAPFAGALEYRPALLLTGESGTGKTQVANLIIKKISVCEWFNGAESTPAGVRGKVKYDSCAIVFDEIEADTQKKRLNRDELFSLMRTNVTDDAPDTVKGTKEGGYNSFKMQNMFGFIAKDPTIESEADENRIFRVNMIEPENANEWDDIKDKIEKLLCKKNCRAIRAMTWKKLKIITKLTVRIAKTIRKNIRKDYRFGYLDSMLASAFIVIWQGQDDPTDEQIENMIIKYYDYQPADEKRSEAEEMVDRIMDEVIEILHNHDHSREKLTILECLNRIYTGIKKIDGIEHEVGDNEIIDYKTTLARYGIRLVDDCNIAIANKHHAIMRIIERGNGYNKILKRHKGLVNSQKSTYFYDGKPRRCTILNGIIEKKYEHKTDDEKLKDVIG